MNKKVKTLMLRCFVVLFITCFCTQLSLARIWQNWRDCINSNDCTEDSSTSLLGTYILESAGYFLKSNAAYQEFLYCVEMSESKGIESADFKNALYNAIDNMKKSNAAYSNLKTASEKIPYNQEMIDQLMKFDYDGFRIKNGLNEPIFEKLRAFLSKGDIAGFDAAVIANMDAILSRLYELKVSVDKGMVPEIALIWRTSQAYTEAQLFGQYMSEVFSDILF